MSPNHAQSPPDQPLPHAPNNIVQIKVRKPLQTA